MSLNDAESAPALLDQPFDAGARTVLVRGRTGMGLPMAISDFVRHRVSRGPILLLATNPFHEQFTREIHDPEAGVDVGAFGSRAAVELVSPHTIHRHAHERAEDTFATIVVAECHRELQSRIEAIVDHFSSAQVLEISYMPKGHPGILRADAEIDLAEPEPSYAPRM